MDIASQDLAPFWNTVLSALTTATYVSFSFIVFMFLVMAISEFRDRKKPSDEEAAEKTTK